jgi:hypothetical protein
LIELLKGSMPKDILFLEKRKVQERILAKIPIRYWSIRDEETEILFERNLDVKVSYSMNISLGGVFLVTKEELQVESMIRLHLFLPSTPFVSTLARVLWTDPQGAGVCFVGMKPKEVAALKEYLTQLKEL